MPTYSIAIRTLGTGGDKYKALLDSISKSSCLPKDVYVFIAEGYDLPNEQLGWEKFVYTRQGMWHQRIYGIEYIASKSEVDYILVLDDDMSFNHDFAEKMIGWMHENQCDVCIPNVTNCVSAPSVLPMFSVKNFMLSLLGGRIENHFLKKRIKIISTAGYMANTALSCDVAPTESGPFNAFFIKADKVSLLNLKDEYWLDDTKYALPDDQVFFYKSYLSGLKQYWHLGVCAYHLDHGSSNPNRWTDAAYASGRNFLIFWHRFLYKRSSFFRKCWLIIAMSYRVLMNLMYHFIVSIYKRNMSVFSSYKNGVKDGLSFLNSSNYKDLPLV